MKHRYTFHWKAQIRLFLLSVTIQIIFTDYRGSDLSVVAINR